MPYQLLCVSVQGASHIRHGMACEDFGLVIENERYRIFVTSDGHGDSNCPRSSYGSEQVCRIAAEEMAVFAEAIADEKWENKLFESRETERILRQLIVSIITKWKTVVEEDYAAHPLTEEERAGAARYIDLYDKGERISHIYGSTMIAGLQTEKYLLLLQQGDGRCVVFSADGTASQPIPWDDLCFLNVTTSMCDEDAVKRCRYHVIDLEKEPVCAVFAGSDGVEDSFFSMDQMESWYRDLLLYAADHSVSELEEYLLKILPSFSEKGSGDDTTITGIIDREKTLSLTEQFQEANRQVELKSQIKLIDDRLRSMEGKLSYLQDKYEKAKEQHRQLFQRFKTSEDNNQKAEAEYRSYRAKYDELILRREELLKAVNEESSEIDSENPEEVFLEKEVPENDLPEENDAELPVPD